MRPAHLVPAGAVLVALGAIAAAAQLATPAPAGKAQVATRQVAVTAAARACPPVPGGGSGQVAFIAGSPAVSAGPALGPGPGTGPGTGAAANQAQLTPLP